MADFHQTTGITTLHNLTRRPIEYLEADLIEFSRVRPIGLVLPCLYSELSGPALGRILDELARVPYLAEIVIGLDRADRDQARHAYEYFARLPQPHRILWNDGPRLRAINAQLEQHELAPRELGKGCNAWYCFGYVLASGRAEAVALHDCDIVTYDRGLLARLVYPVANPAFPYYFCKGFYARVTPERLNGRVTRLLVTPLLRSLKRVFGALEYLEYLDCFRYPLAGEFSLRADVLKDLRIPSDWGLEIGVLSELHRGYSQARICQVDIADAYDHKHQNLSAGDFNTGLTKMSTDIAKAIFRKLATQGQIFSTETFRTIKATYYRTALDLVDAYQHDALMNGLAFDRHVEEQTVDVFAAAIMKAGNTFLENPMETPFIPSWNRIMSAVPDVMTQLREAVDADAVELAG